MCIGKISIDLDDRNILTPKTYNASELGFRESDVSKNALFVVNQLQQAGFDGYLVGGCVRDMVLGLKPKDFDVTTDATPEQVNSIFKRSRIIGRRFKIVHVPFQRARGEYPSREIIEVATYRADATKQLSRKNTRHANQGKKSVKRNRPHRPATSNSGRILDDNVYGTLSEDAGRRDFTVNALYYDPVSNTVLDYCNGVADLKSNTLQIIGQAAVRFSEDPVRMLRAVRFSAKLNLAIDPSLNSALVDNAYQLNQVPAARLFDEVLKLFHHGAARVTWRKLCQTPLAEILFTQTMRALADADDGSFAALIDKALKNTDSRIHSELPVMAGYLYAVLLWKPYLLRIEIERQSGVQHNEAMWAASDHVFKIQNRVVSIPWRVRSPASEIWGLQPRLMKRAPRMIRGILSARRFRAGYDFLEMRAQAGEVEHETVDWWTRIQELEDDGITEMIAGCRTHFSGRSSKRRKQKKRNRGNTG